MSDDQSQMWRNVLLATYVDYCERAIGVGVKPLGVRAWLQISAEKMAAARAMGADPCVYLGTQLGQSDAADELREWMEAVGALEPGSGS